MHERAFYDLCKQLKNASIELNEFLSDHLKKHGTLTCEDIQKAIDLYKETSKPIIQ